MSDEMDFIAAMSLGLPAMLRPPTPPPSDLPDLSPEQMAEGDLAAELR